MSTISPARKAAFTILLAIEGGQRHSDNLLRGRSVEGLSSRDRNLATTLVLGVLRWQIRIDHQLRPLLKHPNAKLDPEVQIALRLGAFQILFLDRIPARAAIDESVELTKQSGHRFASTIVNAVLHRLTREGLVRAEFPNETPAELALAQGHPEWLVERWVRIYGLDTARAICHHGQTQPTLSVRLENSDAEAELVRAGILIEAGHLLNTARSVESGELIATEAFRAGHVRVQDEGSQLVAELASCASEGAMSVLDMCAAPGGKTLILAERCPAAHIVACEVDERRFAQLTKRISADAGGIECRHADATTLSDDSKFDVVLADVPCSGTGTLGRNPEIRHRLAPDDLARQALRQRELLRAALRLVRPGGRVVYSTCSLEPEENDEVVATVLAANRDARQVSISPLINSLQTKGVLAPSAAEILQRCVTPEGGLRLLPGILPTDGFFVSLIERAE